MRLIAFDTSTEWCTAALWLNGAVTLREVHAGQRHSELLVPMITELCAESGVQLNQLDGLAYGMGPGSFTGLRIACGVAQGLAMGAGLQVLGVPTLEALAEEGRVATGAEHVLACLDARMNEVYAGIYRYQAGQWQCLNGPLVCPPGQVPAPAGSDCVGVGSGFAAYPELSRLCEIQVEPQTVTSAASQTQGGRLQLACVRADLFPHARAIAHLAAPRFARGEGGAAETAEPLYIRDKVALKITERQARVPT